MASEMRKLIDEAEGQAWEVSKTKGSHVRFRSPSGVTVFGSSTPSDHRSIKNIRSKLRRAGLSDQKG